MNEVINRLVDFIERTEVASSGVQIHNKGLKSATDYLAGNVGSYTAFVRAESARSGLPFDAERYPMAYASFFLACTKFRWSRAERVPGEGVLSGGVYVNGFADMMTEVPEFWRRSVAPFAEVGQEHLRDRPDGMGWLAGIVAPASPFYAPEYGCFEFVPGMVPSKFFFYDSGLLFPLPFSSMEDYFHAMVDSACVRCWQYFYVDPALIVSKSRGCSYFTWSLHSATRVDRRLRELRPVDNAQHDRLDLVAEYLERCVRLLSESFPFMEFDFHADRYACFHALYDAAAR